ncbi:hypothetical protein Mapa_015399 [Marchantia paleacea]|nr:hypothetical protein Mapa_015399 [Marchantia paleacea]
MYHSGGWIRPPRSTTQHSQTAHCGLPSLPQPGYEQRSPAHSTLSLSLAGASRHYFLSCCNSSLYHATSVVPTMMRFPLVVVFHPPAAAAAEGGHLKTLPASLALCLSPSRPFPSPSLVQRPSPARQVQFIP